MTTPEGRLLDDDASFKELGIDRSVRESWEDGLRLKEPFKPGEWEWWYCDAHFSNGYFCVASFNIEIGADGLNAPFIALNIAKDGQKLCDLKRPLNSSALSTSDKSCEVSLGNSVFRSEDGLVRYHVRVDPEQAEGFGCDLHFESTVPAYRPGTGRWDVDGKHFSWFCAVPGARVTGRLFLDGKAVEVEGNGYHDHNWGNVPMDHILSGWLWGRAEVGGVTVVSASVRFRSEVGGREAPLLYVARGKEVMVDVFNDAVVCLEGVRIPQPDTGKMISSDCIYLVENETQKVSVRFDGQRMVIASFPWVNSSQQWETWYTRFAAKVTVDLTPSDGKPIHAVDAGVLENMDFFGRRLADNTA